MITVGPKHILKREVVTFRPCFHEVTVVRKIVTQSVCDFHSLPSLRENRDDLISKAPPCNDINFKLIPNHV